jgi:LPXTG-site transpeptidase (sortase) family protein
VRAVVGLTDAGIALLRDREAAVWIRRAPPPPAAPVADVPSADPKPAALRPIVVEPGSDGYLLLIPKIGLRAVVRELEPDVFTGANTAALRRYGLGQVPYTADLRNVSPGAEGTAVIAGHRTTSGAPFRQLHRLVRGDLIVTRGRDVERRWVVEGAKVVAPDDVAAIRSRPGLVRLVLLSCSPPFSARDRLLIYAQPAPDPRLSGGSPRLGGPEPATIAAKGCRAC